MKTDTYTLRFITPCFCAGANQAVAELRPPALRGQLRWWFRALGGGAGDEREVFGGIGDAPAASAIIIRVSDIKAGAAWQPPRVDPNRPSSYVWYFASVSGKQPGTRGAGPRWNSQAVLPPGTMFKLHVLRRREIPSALAGQFDMALKCFLALGSCGLRATRGLGAFVCEEVPFDANIETFLRHAGEWTLEVRDLKGDFASEIGSLVKGTRGALNMKSSRATPFGSSSPRQTSGVWFRPLADHRLAIFQPPARRVLAPSSRNGSPISGNLFQHT